MLKKKSQGFTLVELIVVITILAILATIAFISFTGYQRQARDSTRISDIKSISKVIELYQLQSNSFPQVTNPINVTFSGAVIWKQGSFGVDSRRDSTRISDIPTDPLTGNEYAYSVTTSSQEYQIGTILEGGLVSNIGLTSVYANEVDLDSFSAYIGGNYNGRFLVHKEAIDENNERIYILGVPSILAIDTSDVTIESILINNNLLYSGKRIAPATYSGSLLRDEDWSFTPQITSYGTTHSSIAVVYEGTTTELSSGSGKIDLVENLKSYYASSDIASSDGINDFNIDTLVNPNDAIELVNDYISGNLGGLENTSVSKSIVSSSGSGGGGSGGGGWPVSCNDMTATHLSNLNAWADVDIVTDNRGNPIPPEGTAIAGTSSHSIPDWCSLTLLDMSYGGFPNLIDELGLLENLLILYIYDDNVSAIPETLANLTSLEELDLEENTALGNLNAYFDPSSPKTCQAGISTLGNQMCVEGNGTKLIITVE